MQGLRTYTLARFYCQKGKENRRGAPLPISHLSGATGKAKRRVGMQ
jgi:hypothetical protein